MQPPELLLRRPRADRHKAHQQLHDLQTVLDIFVFRGPDCARFVLLQASGLLDRVQEHRIRGHGVRQQLLHLDRSRALNDRLRPVGQQDEARADPAREQIIDKILRVPEGHMHRHDDHIRVQRLDQRHSEHTVVRRSAQLNVPGLPQKDAAQMLRLRIQG